MACLLVQIHCCFLKLLKYTMSKELICLLLQKVVKKALDKMCFVSLCHGQKEDHGLHSSVDASSAVSRGLKILTTLFAWTRGVLIWSLWTPRVKKICFKKLGKIQIFVFLGTKMPIARALLGPNGRNFDTRTVGV